MLNPLSKEKRSALQVITGSICALLLISIFSSAHAVPANGIPPLVENIRTLHCATDQASAQSALERLKNNLDPVTGLPDEWEGTISYRSSVHAGTIDLAIHTIIDKASTFPELSMLAESVMFNWNYCEIYHNGIYYDVNADRTRVDSTPVDYTSPSNWLGLTQLGLGISSSTRYLPRSLYDTEDTLREKVLYNWWHLQRNQCLPHPANGQMFHRQQYVPRGKVNTDTANPSLRYPLLWENNCTVAFTETEVLLQENQANKTLEQEKAALQYTRTSHSLREWQENTRLKRDQQLQEVARLTREKARSPEPALYAATPPLQSIFLAKPSPRATRPDNLAQLPISASPDVGKMSSSDPRTSSDEPPRVVTQESAQSSPGRSMVVAPGLTLTASEAKKNESDLATRYQWYKSQLSSIEKLHTEQVLTKLTREEPDIIYRSEPTLAAANPANQARISYQSGSVPPFKTIANRTPEPKKDRVYHGLSGSFALSNQKFEENGWSFTANFSYKPLRDNFYFARSGVTLVEGDEPASYYWGIGYNDWHPGTWAFELNNWGPLNPGDGLMLEKAIASISYKFDSVKLQTYNLSTSATISGGKSSDPALTLAGSWSPKPNWFIRNLFTQPLNGGSTTWAYGFGYNNWRSQTWSLEYNNWGPNTLERPNIRDNALVTLSWKWNL